MQRYAAEQAEIDLKRAYASLEASLPLTAAAPASAAGRRVMSSGWSALSGTTKLLIGAAIAGTSALSIAALRGDEHPTVLLAPTSELLATRSGQLTAQPVRTAFPQPETAPAASAHDQTMTIGTYY